MSTSIKAEVVVDSMDSGISLLGLKCYSTSYMTLMSFFNLSSSVSSSMK